MKEKFATIQRALAAGPILLALITVLLLPAQARKPSALRVLPCACCADEGDWFQISQKVDTGILEEIGRVKFSDVTNASRDDDDAVTSDGKFALSRTKDGRHWQLRFAGNKGKGGVLSLPIPLRFVSFAADVHDGQLGGGGGPLLYKEWRFAGPITGTGAFQRWQSKGAKFQLVLQGRGNHCTQAEDFKHWILNVENGATKLSFYGSLSQ